MKAKKKKKDKNSHLYCKNCIYHAIFFPWCTYWHEWKKDKDYCGIGIRR